MMYYKINKDKSVEATDNMEEAWESKDEYGRVGDDDVGDARVSTVFLSLDHNFGYGEPHIFETMIFSGEFDQYQWRYSTYDEALKGHNDIVEMIEFNPEELLND